MPQLQPLYPPIISTEVKTVCFDFGLRLESGVYLTSAAMVCQAEASTTVDPDPSSRLIGNPHIVNSVPLPNGSGIAKSTVIQQVGNMIANVVYMLKCTVTTSDGQTLSLWTHLPCIS